MFGLISGAIGAVGSLLGAKKQQKAAEADRDYQNWYNDPAQVRERAEAAGFNPLAFIGPYQSASAQAGYSGIGSGIANAALLASDALTKYGDKIGKVAELEQQNEKLQKQLEKNTIRPQVGGVYGGGVVPHASALIGSPVSNGQGVPLDKMPDLPIHLQPDVNLWSPSAGKQVAIPAGYAKRLELKDGDAIMAEDYEAMFGDIGSEIINTPNTANYAIGAGQRLTGNRNSLPPVSPTPKSISGPKVSLPRQPRSDYRDRVPKGVFGY